MKVLAGVAVLLAIQFIPFTSLTLQQDNLGAINHITQTMESTSSGIINALGTSSSSNMHTGKHIERF